MNSPDAPATGSPTPRATGRPVPDQRPAVPDQRPVPDQRSAPDQRPSAPDRLPAPDQRGAAPDQRSARPGTPAEPPRATPPTPDADGDGDGEGDGLTDRERDILAFERQWWKHAGAKEQAIRDTFGLSATRYYQLLNNLLDNPAALAAEPQVVGRLRRLRAARARSRHR